MRKIHVRRESPGALFEKEIHTFWERATYLEIRSHTPSRGDRRGNPQRDRQDALTGVGRWELRGGGWLHPGRLIIPAAGTAAGPAHRTLGASGHDIRVPNPGRCVRYDTPGCHRTRARRKQRGGRRVCGLVVEGRYPHLLQRHAASRLHQAGRALASAYGSWKFVTYVLVCLILSYLYLGKH